MWQQNYQPIAGNLGLSAIVSSMPILVLFYMLGIRRKPAWMAAVTAMSHWLLPLVVSAGPPGSERLQ